LPIKPSFALSSQTLAQMLKNQQKLHISQKACKMGLEILGIAA